MRVFYSVARFSTLYQCGLCVSQRQKSTKNNVGKILKELNYENYKIYGKKLNRKSKRSTVNPNNKDGDNTVTKPVTEFNNNWRPLPKPKDKVHTSLDCISDYPLLRCQDQFDNSVLLRSAGSHLPSVTHIMNETMSDLSKFYLERWKKKIISELGEEGFNKLQEGIYIVTFII